MATRRFETLSWRHSACVEMKRSEIRGVNRRNHEPLLHTPSANVVAHNRISEELHVDFIVSVGQQPFAARACESLLLQITLRIQNPESGWEYPVGHTISPTDV